MADYLAHQVKLIKKWKAKKQGGSQGTGSMSEATVSEEDGISAGRETRLPGSDPAGPEGVP